MTTMPTDVAATSGLALLFPGQGSQAVGMGKELCEHSAAAREVFARADEALSMRISELCFQGPSEELMRTANTQPAILACSMAALAAAREALTIEPAVCLGHSLGEWSAWVECGAISFEDAIRLVRLRGRAMQEAVPEGRGGMAAIVGLSADEVEAVCVEASTPDEPVAPANENGGGQVVVAGLGPAVERAMSLAKARKGRAIPLKVSAPFHCVLMQPAAQELARALEPIEIRAPRRPVIANVSAEPCQDAASIKRLLIDQVTGRVRWESSVRTAMRMGVTRAYEVGHGRVLRDLARKIDAELKVFPLGSPADIDVLRSETLQAATP